MHAWLQWFGNFHVIFLHFPIALIIMTCIAELLALWKKDPRYEFVAKFMLIAAAIFVIPTGLSGLSMELTGNFDQETQTLIDLHLAFGILTLAWTLITLFLCFYAKKRSHYYISLSILLLSVIITSYLGGLIAFGYVDYLPPLFHAPTPHQH